jgi:hypothetical protein
MRKARLVKHTSSTTSECSLDLFKQVHDLGELQEDHPDTTFEADVIVFVIFIRVGETGTGFARQKPVPNVSPTERANGAPEVTLLNIERGIR